MHTYLKPKDLPQTQSLHRITPSPHPRSLATTAFFSHEFLLYIILFYSALSRTNQDSLSSHPQATKAGIFSLDYSILSVAELTLADHWDSKKIEKKRELYSRTRREASKQAQEVSAKRHGQ